MGPDLEPYCLQTLSADDSDKRLTKLIIEGVLNRALILLYILGFGKPVLYIPWIVLQELDSLKQACSKRLPKLVRIKPFLYRWSLPSCFINQSIYGEGHRLKFLNIVGCSRFCRNNPFSANNFRRVSFAHFSISFAHFDSFICARFCILFAHLFHTLLKFNYE